MTVNNGGFPGPFIISIFEKRSQNYKGNLHWKSVGSEFWPGEQNSGLVNPVPNLRAQIGSTYKEIAQEHETYIKG